MSGGNGIALKERQYSVPGEDGARVSRLFRLLAKGHHDVALPPGDLRRLTLWLDCNSNFYGAYHDLAAQGRGDVVRPPLRRAALERVRGAGALTVEGGRRGDRHPGPPRWAGWFQPGP
jgi:hypothetical protein